MALCVRHRQSKPPREIANGRRLDCQRSIELWHAAESERPFILELAGPSRQSERNSTRRCAAERHGRRDARIEIQLLGSPDQTSRGTEVFGEAVEAELQIERRDLACHARALAHIA